MAGTDDWKLFYWCGTFPGRGEFVRLMFEEAGVPYEDVCRKAGNSEEILKVFRGEQEKGFPMLSPPFIQNGDFFLGQTPAILEYLGKRFGLYPEGGPEEEAHCMQLSLTVADLLQECMDAFHPVDRHQPYLSQKEEAVPYIEAFRKVRLPRVLKNLEKALKFNNGGEGFFVGKKITYADISVFQILRGAEFQFPDDYRDLPIPTLRAFAKRMAERPRIKAFLESDRCTKFSDSMS